MSDVVDAEKVLWIYVVTRADLPALVQGIQLGHATSECVTPDLAPLPKNTRLCWLQAKDEAELLLYVDELQRKNIPHAAVIETDEPYIGQLMSLATTPSLQRSKLRKIFHHLQKAKFE